MCDVCCKDSLRKIVFRILDLFLILFIITPACVFSWRGTWILMDVYLLPTTPKYSYWISVTAGISYVICCHFLQDILKQLRIKLRKLPIINVVVTRLYYYLAGVFAINVWRGVWGLLDTYLGTGTDNTNDQKFIETTVFSSLLGFVVLISFRCINNLSFPPAFLSLDWNENPFDVFHTRFETHEGETTFCDDLKHIGDVLLSYLLLIPAAVTIWRGTWEIIDLLLDPDNPKLTGIISALYGYLMFILVLIVNPFVQRAADKLSRFWLLRLIFLQFYAFIKFTAVNNMWRGVWYILDSYVFPDNRHYRGIMAHVVGFTVLIIMGASRSSGEVVFSVDGVNEPEPVLYLPHLRKACSNGRYSLLSTKDSSEEASQTDNDEINDLSTDYDVSQSDVPEVI